MRIIGRETSTETFELAISFLFFLIIYILSTFPIFGNVKALFLWYFLFFLGMVIIPSVILAAWYLLPRATRAAMRLLDELEGLRMFIRAAERKYLDGAPAPGTSEDQAMSESWYRQLLPWAIALGAEKQWTNAFRSWQISLETGLGTNLTQDHLPEIDFGKRPGTSLQGNAAEQSPRISWLAGMNAWAEKGGA